MNVRHRSPIIPIRQIFAAPLLIPLLLSLLLSLSCADTGLAGPLQLQAVFDNDYINAARPEARYLEVLVTTSPGIDRQRKRVPLNLALVIDTSGSMGDENKLNYVKQAAIAMLKRLRPEDRLAIITYDTSAKVVLPSSPVRMEREARWLIESLRANGGTNLGAGLSEGYRQLREFAGPSTTNRLLLLSDGKANTGITSSAELSRMVLAQADAGISLSSFGVGLDFNEDLLAALSESGRGMYYFIDHPESMEAILAKEFNSVERLVAADIKVTVTLGGDMVIEQVFANNFTINGNTVSVRFGDLAAGERRRMQIRFQPRRRRPGSVNNAARVDVSYTIPGDSGSGSLSRGVGLAYIENAKTAEANLNRDVAERSAVFEANHAKQEAARAFDRGDRSQADSILDRVRKKLGGLASRNSRVRGEVSDMESYQKTFEQSMPASKRALEQKRVKYKSQAIEGC
jgi:Ca-activated chloride channel family protein